MNNQYADFERDGEEVVRKNLSRGAYIPRRAKEAEAWLDKLDRARKDASSDEQMRIARSAKNAAWMAAIAAIIAAICAAIAIALSFHK